MTSAPILYIHGFASTGSSPKASQLQEMTGRQVLAPSLSHDPYEDMEVLGGMIRDHGVGTVVGTSLGGFYALYLAQKFDVGLVVINPSLTPYKTLGSCLNPAHPVYGTEDVFSWTREKVEALKTLGHVVSAATSTKNSNILWSRALLMVAENDDVVPCGDAITAMPYAAVVKDPSQGHRFQDLMPYADAILKVVNAPDPGDFDF